MRASAAVLVLALLLACTPASPGATTPSPSGPAPTVTAAASPSPAPAECPAVRQISPAAISGRVGYPAEGAPPLALIAVSADNPNVYRVVHTQQVQAGPPFSYTIAGVEPGTYVVLAYVEGGTGNRLAGAFTPAVACGLQATCTDHSLIRVAVRSGQDVTGIDILDWYAPPGTFPGRPPGSEPLPAGEAVRLCNPFADSANMRASAGVTFPVRRTLDNGTRLVVRGGPLGASGYDWYEVNVAGDQAASGWVIAYALRK